MTTIDKDYDLAVEMSTANNESNGIDRDTNNKYVDVREIMEKTGYKHTTLITSGRSSGKSFSCANMVVEDCIKNKHEFILMTWNMLQISGLGGWCNHCTEYLGLPGKIYVKYDTFIYDSEEKGSKPQVIGHMTALSQEENIKSGAFPKVKWIVFEEFVQRDPTRYIQHGNPVQAIGSLCSTVFRTRNEGYVIMLGNIMDANSYNNPFITAFDIPADEIEVDTPWTTDEFGGVAYYHAHMAIKPNTLWFQALPGNDTAQTGEPLMECKLTKTWLTEHGFPKWEDFSLTPAEWYSFGKYGYFLIHTAMVSKDDVVYNVVKFQRHEPDDNFNKVTSKMVSSFSTSLVLLQHEGIRKPWAKATSVTNSYWDVMTPEEHTETKEEKRESGLWFIDPNSLKLGFPLPKESDDPEENERIMEAWNAWSTQ